MKVTRFVNGKKITEPFDEKTVIKHDVISDTIERVNHRLNIKQSLTDSMENSKNE